MNAPDSPHWPREFMLERMLAADATYDGAFITGVISTGIYCLPSCRARKPKPENVVFCSHPAQAQALGLRPCRRCRPNDYYAGIDLTERRILTALQSSPTDLSEWARRAEFSPSRLHDLCRHYFHAPPAEVLTESRIHQAQRQLLESTDSITQVAYEVGFQSLSAFRTQFLQHTATTPSELRSWRTTGQLKLRLPAHYSVEGALHELGRDPCATTAALDGQTYRARVWAAGQAARFKLRFQSDLVVMQVDEPEGLQPASWFALLQGVLQLLGLERSRQVVAFERLAAKSPLWQGRQNEGLHLHGSFDAFDAAVWAVLGQVVTFKQAAQWQRHLLSLLSEAKEGLLLPPSPAGVATLDATAWDSLSLPARKVTALKALAAAFSDGSLPLQRGTSTLPSLERQLLALPGVGPWTAAYTLLRGYGFGNVYPQGDVALGNHAPPGHLEAMLEAVQPYRSLGALHLWQSSHR